MKIAIITIHYVTNFGAILQAYATKEIFSKYGEVKIINYQKRYLNRHIDLIRFEPSLRGIKWLLHDLLNFSSRYKMVSKFKSFIDSSLNLTSRIQEHDNFGTEFSEFDIYVCGSDQIWNPGIISSTSVLDPVYFLSFAPKGSKKISYASSIGHHHFTEEEKMDVKKMLSDFSHISIRENDGKKKLLEIFPNKNVEVVLDPTLLLTKEEWLQCTRIPQNDESRERYILVYSVPRTKLIKKAVAYFSKKLNYKIVSIDKMLFPLTKVDVHVNNAGPREFLELFANASFVISDSFHGLCFALNFEVPFVAVSSNKVGNRQENLLALMEVDEGKVLARNENDFDKIQLDLNFDGIRNKLQHYRQNSISYIKNSVNNTNE